MNREDTRLRTFENWPENAPVDPQRIAKAGFYFTGQGMEVQCFCCGGKLHEWNYGDQVMARHREVSPSCPFVHNPASSGNVPIILSSSPSFDGSFTARPNIPTLSAPSSTGPSDFERLQSSLRNAHVGMLNQSSLFQSEAMRLETFRNWPIPNIVSPERLAKAGFYYQGTGDQVKCAFCGGCVTLWEEGDDPLREHQRHFPSCSFLYNIPVGNVPLEEDSNHFSEWGVQASSGDTSLKELGIQTHHGPMCPDLSTVESRLRTFRNWPEDVVQRPEEIAAAGFYYTGNGDQVRCFHCDGGLRLWDPADDPWMEHARWFNCCPFVLLVKGEEYVRQAVAQSEALSQEQSVPDTSEPAPEPERENERSRCSTPQPPVPPEPPTPEPPPESYPPPEPYPPRRPPGRLTEDELKPYMNSSVVIAALTTGLDFPRVKMAVKRHVERRGEMFEDPDALIEAALNVQHEQEMNAFEMGSLDDDYPTWRASPRGGRSSGARRNCSENRSATSRPQHNRSSEEARLQSTDTLSSSSQGSTPGTMSQSLPSLAGAADGDSHKTTEKTGSSLLCRQSLPVLPSEGEDISNMIRKVSLEEENRRLREARLCKICMDSEACVVFLPCGHLVTCVNCAPSLAHCPICRQLIKATVRTFMS